MTTSPQNASPSLTQAQASAEPRSLPLRAAREVALVLAGTAAITLIGQLRVPLPFIPVPVTLGTFAVLGVGALLGWRRALPATLLFASLAALGAPVLAGWQGGVTVTFGYVLGYCLAGVVAGWAARKHQPWLRLPFMVAASAAVYVPGVAWLMVSTGKPLAAVLAVGVLPFLIGDLLKSVVAALLPRLDV
ncbi:Biotin ECF transporter S component BioY [Actinomyces bovis]|uniref:Biotin transporter n=1 Tax=Actinomyces bovis TaxID=1658 RepID=A0ABY1VM77_9ACTO|nr:biotin transporter BioY [Actinomyces bovis]SPT53208.1 Biotin ECF transporter S component BioY [Actinomyces bovis]VEG52433.1 Biotin ECF transporter S component BioY [Actinomyces israelii]